MIDCVVIVPVLGRPTSAQPLVDSFYRATNPGSARLLFVATDGDAAQIRACYETGEQVAVMPERRYAPKVNAGFLASHTPWVFQAADDLEFHEGWLEAALAVSEGVGVVGTNDLGNPLVMRGGHATHMLFRREYVNEHGTVDAPGKVLHEGYQHCWVDNEAFETARWRGQFAFAANSHVEHRHPIWKKGEDDETYRLGQKHYLEDRKLFQSRRRLWSGQGGRAV